LDTGTPDSLMDASNYIATIERRQGLKIGCIEEVAYRMGYIKQDQLKKIINQSLENDYQRYLKVILNEKIK